MGASGCLREEFCRFLMTTYLDLMIQSKRRIAGPEAWQARPYSGSMLLVAGQTVASRSCLSRINTCSTILAICCRTPSIVLV